MNASPAARAVSALRRWSSQKYSTSSSVTKMPDSTYKPQAYMGPTYNKVREIRKTNISPAVKTVYKEPVLFHDAYMQWLFDYTGKRYLDMFGGIVTVSVGHKHPKVVEALNKQAGLLWHTSNLYMNPRIHEYCEALASKFPGDLKVVYLVNSGTEANDLAMLLCRVYTKHHDIISLRNAFHGTSPNTVDILGLSEWKYYLSTKSGIHQVMNPDVYQGLWGGLHCRDSPVQVQRQCDCQPSECKASELYFNQVEEVFKYSVPKGRVAGFFAESIQGVGGSVQFPKGYLKKVYELVRNNGGLCVADEVQTGFGRTGEHFWGFEMHDVIPDIVTAAKGIGNGFPLAAVVTTPKIAEALTEFHHFNTFGGNPLASAVGLSVLKVIEEEKLQKNSHEVGTYLLEKLSDLRTKFEFVGDVRGKGLMIGIELVTDKKSKTPMEKSDFEFIIEETKNLGVIFGRGGRCANVIRIKPPMCITKDDADYSVSVLHNVFTQFQNKK